MKSKRVRTRYPIKRQISLVVIWITAIYLSGLGFTLVVTPIALVVMSIIAISSIRSMKKERDERTEQTKETKRGKTEFIKIFMSYQKKNPNVSRWCVKKLTAIALSSLTPEGCYACFDNVIHGGVCDPL